MTEPKEVFLVQLDADDDGEWWAHQEGAEQELRRIHAFGNTDATLTAYTLTRKP